MKPVMRILFISYELPPIGGGGGRAAWQIARRLARRGHEVEILTSLEGVRVHRIRVRRKNIHACPPPELLSFMLRSFFAAPRLAAWLRPDGNLMIIVFNNTDNATAVQLKVNMQKFPITLKKFSRVKDITSPVPDFNPEVAKPDIYEFMAGRLEIDMRPRDFRLLVFEE